MAVIPIGACGRHVQRVVEVEHSHAHARARAQPPKMEARNAVTLEMLSKQKYAMWKNARQVRYMKLMFRCDCVSELVVMFFNR